VQDPHDSFFNALQFLAKAAMPASVSSLHERSLRRVRLRQRLDIATNASSPMLVDLRSHFRASLVTESKREKRNGTKGRRSDWALRESR